MYQVWLKVTHWFWRRRQKCEKVTDRWMDRGRATDDHKSSLELSAQVRYMYKEKNTSWYHTALIGVSKSKWYYQTLLYYLTYFYKYHWWKEFTKCQYITSGSFNMESTWSVIDLSLISKWKIQKTNKITPGNVNHTQLIFIQSIIHCTKLSISICIHAYL